MTQVIIKYISGGTFPVNVFIADKYGNNKSQIGTVNPGPVPPPVKYNITIPPIFDTAETVMLILEDVNGCVIFKLLDCPPQTFEICLIFQDGREFGTQGSEPPFCFSDDQVCAQQSATTYTVTSGFSSPISACSSKIYVDNYYSAVGSWPYVITLYYDSEMNVRVYGDDLWYRAKGSSTALQINNNGYVTNSQTCS